MPAKPKAQQKAAGAALSAKRGETEESSPKEPSKNMAASMSEDSIAELASSKRENLPREKD